MARLLALFEKWLRQPPRKEIGAANVDRRKLSDRREAFLQAAPELSTLSDEYEASVRFENASKLSPGTLSSNEKSPPLTLEDFMRIPPENLTAEILKHGADLTRDHSSLAGVKFTRDYRSLVKRMTQKDAKFISYVHGAFISDLMAAEYLVGQRDEFDPVSRKNAWLMKHPHFTPGPIVIHAMLMRRIRLHDLTDEHWGMLNDDVLRQIYLHRPNRARELAGELIDRPKILEDMIQSGYYPRNLDGNSMLAVRIDKSMTTHDLLTSLMKCHDDEPFELACLGGLLKRRPIAEVIAAADTLPLKKTLIKLYEKDELLVEARNDRHIKGMILEDDLGM